MANTKERDLELERMILNLGREFGGIEGGGAWGEVGFWFKTRAIAARFMERTTGMGLKTIAMADTGVRVVL